MTAQKNADAGRIREVSAKNIDVSASGQGGSSSIMGMSAVGAYSSSLVFSSGVRNPSYQPDASYSFYSAYGEGPTEPSLASVAGSALLKQSSPLTIVTAGNERSEIVTYTVRPGDIPSVIAASFGITVNTLLWANDLSDGQYIRPGDELSILPVSGVRYKVRSGDTVLTIASRYKGEAPQIIAFNELDAGGGIVEGEYIIIPDGEMPVPSYAKSYAAKYSSYTVNLDGYFSHPTAGVGYRSRGLHPHNAVDIAASCWTPIYAAAAGSVLISDANGWNSGYGRYIKIDHQNDTQTLYAHNIQNQVVAGQSVQQGELIAYMGSTGQSSGCHVHWEVRGALNPLR